MRENTDETRSPRRTFLKGSLGAAGTMALAGCFGGGGGGGGDGDGDGDGDGGGGDGSGDGDGGGDGGSAPGADGQMIMTTSTETTAAYSMSQVIANAVNQNNDTVNVSARPSEGTNANVGRLSREESDIAYVQNWTASKIANGEEPFGELDYTPYQVFHLYDLQWFLCTANEEWETVADIESGSRVSPTPRGSGTAEMLEHALGYVTEDYERVSVDYGGQGGAMSEGRLDVGAGTFINGSVEPGWLQQMKGTVDLRLLGFPDDVISDLEDDPAIIMSQIETDEFENFGYTPNPLNTPALAYNFVVRDDFDGDTLRTFLDTLWEQREALGEDNALLGPMADGEFWTENGYSTLPFHPAAVEFYQDKGVWNDDYEVGE